METEGKGLEWAAAEAERAIHDNGIERLAQLVGKYPALPAWRSDSGESLLGFATSSFGDSGDSFREQMFTRIQCAEFLLDAGATAEPAIWEDAIRAGAKGVLQLLSRKGVLPRELDILAALGEHKWYGSPWLTAVMNKLEAAMHKNDPEEFNHWLQREADLGSESNVRRLVGLVEIAAYNDRRPFITRLLEFAPAIQGKRPPSSAIRNWSTHEPASILHECAIHGNYEAAQFPIESWHRHHNSLLSLEWDCGRMGVTCVRSGRTSDRG